MRLRLLLACLAAVVAAASAAPVARAALAQGEIAEAAESLRSDPVYVDPDAENALSPSEERRLETRIVDADAGPMYIAVMPAAAAREAGGDADEVLRELFQALEERGTYAVVVGDDFRAGSTGVSGLERGEVPELADEAYREHRGDGVAPTLLDFVTRVAEARNGDRGRDGSGDGGSDGAGLGFLALLAAAGGGFFLWRRRRRTQEQRAAFAEVKEAAEEDLVALAEDVKGLDLEVEIPGADPGAKEDYGRAVELYGDASERFRRARRPDDLEPVTTAIEEGRFAMACAKARLEGRPLPERRPPCFFDPRHGPSVRDVEWAPDGGQPRLVPACAADAITVEEGHEPSAREVRVGGRMVPYWNAPAYYGPWAGGYFGAFGGLFPGLLVGSMLGSSLGLGMGPLFGGPIGIGDESGGGDLAGGDFGDFGGGDFGGGDFGGGDFGGGDF